MPRVLSLHDKSQIEAVARQNLYMHLYEIGDLDDFFWPFTTWYGWQNSDKITQLALLYTALDTPVFVAHSHPPHGDMLDFLQTLKTLLPTQFYTHLDRQILSALTDDYCADPHGLHWKMGLAHPLALTAIDTSEVIQFGVEHLGELRHLYDAYPDNWFDKRMLETGRYYGIRQGDQIISVAGIHVYSPTFKVAALGNVTTHPAHRGQGLGKKVCAKLCQALLDDGIEAIGLNVLAENEAAIRVYKRIGFEKMGEYGEYMMTLKK